MNLKTYILLLALLFSFFLVGCAEQITSTGSDSTQDQQTIQKGRAVFAITDAAAEMDSVTSVKVTVDKVMVHSEAEGWITVSSSPKTYDLLELKAEGKQELLADVQLSQGSYNQIRLDISNVVVADNSGQHEAKLPSGQLKVNSNLEVKSGETATATFDFIADESLHVTGKGEYIMSPVLQVETRNGADVQVQSGNRVEINGGSIRMNSKVGMDIHGNVEIGAKIEKDADLTIDSGSIKISGKSSTEVKVPVIRGNTIFTISDSAAKLEGINSVKVTINGLTVKEDLKGWFNVTTNPQTFDLLQLRASQSQSLLASLDLPPGYYKELRLQVSNVIVTDANGEHEAKLPSNELKFFGVLVVETGLTSVANFDFILDESLHVTGNGDYIMAPVIQLETKSNADVELKEHNIVEVKSGDYKSSTKVGMDEKGNVGIGVSINPKAELAIESGQIKVKSKIQLG